MDNFFFQHIEIDGEKRLIELFNTYPYYSVLSALSKIKKNYAKFPLLEQILFVELLPQKELLEKWELVVKSVISVQKRGFVLRRFFGHKLYYWIAEENETVCKNVFALFDSLLDKSKLKDQLFGYAYLFFRLVEQKQFDWMDWELHKKKI